MATTRVKKRPTPAEVKAALRLMTPATKDKPKDVSEYYKQQEGTR